MDEGGRPSGIAVDAVCELPRCVNISAVLLFGPDQEG
jgi:hypothetical protein